MFLLCDNVAYDGFGETITGYVFDGQRTDGWMDGRSEICKLHLGVFVFFFSFIEGCER